MRKTWVCFILQGDHLTLIAQVKVPLAGVSAAAAALGGGGVGKHGGRLSVASGAMHGGLLGEPVLELIRVSLAADGFGTNLSHLENLSNHVSTKLFVFFCAFYFGAKKFVLDVNIRI